MTLVLKAEEGKSHTIEAGRIDFEIEFQKKKNSFLEYGNVRKYMKCGFPISST